MDNAHRLAVELAQARESEPALRQERDEARRAARELLELLQSSAADHDHDELLFTSYPFLRPRDHHA